MNLLRIRAFSCGALAVCTIAIVSCGPAKSVAPPVPVATATPTARPTATATANAGATATPTAGAIPTATPTSTPTASGVFSGGPTPVATSAAKCTLGEGPGDWNCSDGTVGNAFVDKVVATNSNATGYAPTITSQYFLTNPGTFVVPGTVVAAVQFLVSDTPAMISTQNAIYSNFAYTANGPNFVANESFTCSVFAGSTFVAAGSGTAATTPGGVFGACLPSFPNSEAGTNPQPGVVYFVLGNGTFYTGETYTIVISH